MNEPVKATYFEVAPISQAEGAPRSLKAWASPKVIVSETADTEGAVSTGPDGIASSNGS
jgi:hypothetical protein